MAYKDEDYLNLIIETSCCFAENGYLRFNAFNSFFSKTNTENKAIDCYFIKFKEMPVVFYFLAGQFANYVDFLRKGYVSGKFSDCRLLFDYCVREFDKDSDERKSFTSLISDTKYSDADESLQNITISDNVNRNTNTKKLLFIKYIFDYNTFKKELTKIMRKHSFTDCKLWDLWRVLHSEYFYDAPELVFAEILKENMSFDSLISDFFGLIESNNDNLERFVISVFLQFTKEYDDYEKYVNEEQFALVSSICRKQLVKYIPDEHINYENGCFFDNWFIRPFCSLASKFDIQVDEATFLKMLYIPAFFFNDIEKDGFPQYLINHISEEKILQRIYYYIDKNLAKGDLSEACILYCNNHNIFSDKIVKFAQDCLLKENSDQCNYTAWNYLINQNKTNLLIDLIIKHKIHDRMLFDQMYTIIDCYNVELMSYISELFDSLYCFYLSGDTKELIEKYPFVDEISDNGTLQSKLKECLKRLFEYLIRHNSHKHVELYLHDMIETKTFSPFEKDHFETYVSYISDIRFIDKLIELLKMSCVRDFDMGDFSNLISNIEKSIMNIAVGNEDLVIDKVSELKDADNACLRRTVNKIIDQLVENKNEENKETYSIKELQEFAFWDA